MAIGINEINTGIGLKINDEIYLVTEYHHVKPGKGSAFVRVRLRSLKNDAMLERTFRSSDKLEDVNLEEKKFEFLYRSGNIFHFMDHSTYEGVVITQDQIGEGANFLLENLQVEGLTYNNKVLKVILPNFIVAKIVESEPGIRGDSTKLGTKPAKIETGAIIQVPLFINTDDWVKIDTRTGEYVERVQK